MKKNVQKEPLFDLLRSSLQQSILPEEEPEASTHDYARVKRGEKTCFLSSYSEEPFSLPNRSDSHGVVLFGVSQSLLTELENKELKQTLVERFGQYGTVLHIDTCPIENGLVLYYANPESVELAEATNGEMIVFRGKEYLIGAKAKNKVDPFDFPTISVNPTESTRTAEFTDVKNLSKKSSFLERLSYFIFRF